MRLAPRLLFAFGLALWAIVGGCDCDATLLPDPPPECDEESGKGCLSDEKCVQGRCQLLENCEGDDECPSAAWYCVFPAQICELRPGFGEECLETTDCEPGYFCALGVCREIAEARQCSRRADCPLGQACDRNTFLCIEEGPCTLADVFTELACDPGEVCETFSERCALPCQNECTQATEEEDCGVGSRCDGSCRCVQCLGDEDCGPGLICNTRAGRCESEDLCYSDEDCDAPLVCDPATALCQVPPPPCESDLDCDIAEICNRATGICELPGGECVDDRFENADTPSAAEEIDVPADGTPLVVDDLQLCPDDDDVYGVALEAGDNLVVRVSGTATQARATVWLLDSEGETSVRFAMAPPFGNGTISYVAQEAETIFLRVNALLGQSPYEMELIRMPGEPCADDAFEGEMGNDTLETATPAAQVPLDVTMVASVCPGDEDYLTIDLAEGEGVEVSLAFDETVGDLDLELLDAESGALLSRSAGLANPERLRMRSPAARSIVVRVSGYANASGDYQLTLTSLPEFECTADPSEPDNDTAGAVLLPAGTDVAAEARTLCVADTDVYEVPLEDFERLVARASFATEELDVQMRVLASDGETVLETSPDSAGGETISYAAQGNETVFLEIASMLNTSGPYTLEVWRENQISCVPDAYEPNEGTAAASAPPSTPETLTICDSDNDFFAVEGVAGKKLVARASFIHADGDLDVMILGHDGVQVLSVSDGVGNEEQAEALLPLDETYFVRVFSLSSGAKSRYDLDIRLENVD
jgi:hypothetical protein